MKKTGRNKGKRSYAIVDSLGRIQVILDTGGQQRIYSTKKSAIRYLGSTGPLIGLRVAPVEIAFIVSKTKTKKKK